MAKLRLQKAVAAMGAAPSSNDLTNAIALVDQAIQDSRTLIFELCPPMLADLGLEAALEWLSRQFAEKHGLQVRFQDDRHRKVLSEALAMFLFRATRELLTNVVKHAGAREAVVAVWKDEEYVHIAVEDNGAGCNKAITTGNFDRGQGGFGLFSIRERLALIGGHLKFQSKPGAGTRVEIAMPTKLAII
jgi:signal transduction histidine kinase